MDNTLTVDFGAKIDPMKIDINKIVADVQSDIDNRYGSMPDLNQVVTNIVSQINSSSVQSINQIVSSSQAIVLKGTGITVVNVSMHVVINAVMNAIAQACTDDTCVINELNDLVQSQMTWIKNQVDKQVVGDFSKIWDENKWYIIGAGIFLLLLMLLIVILLIYRAMHGRN
jgi:hypothetical protein